MIAEVRLAPHMDSLVIIYRNMKIAAGVKLYGLQPCMSKDSRGKFDSPTALLEYAMLFLFSFEFTIV